MKTINNVDEAWAYAQQLGFLPKPSPGWIPEAQSRMVALSSLLERMAGYIYPYKVRTSFFVSEAGFRFPWLSTVYVDGAEGHMTCELQQWPNANSNNAETAPILYWMIDSHDEGAVDDVPPSLYQSKLWLHEAKKYLKQYLDENRRRFPSHNVVATEDGMSGTIAALSGGPVEVNTIIIERLPVITRCSAAYKMAQYLKGQSSITGIPLTGLTLEHFYSFLRMHYGEAVCSETYKIGEQWWDTMPNHERMASEYRTTVTLALQHLKERI